AALPPHVTVAGASDGGTEAAGAVTWPAFSLPALASATRTLTLRVDEAVPLEVRELTTTATVTDDGTAGPDPTPGNNTASDTNRVSTVRADAGGPYAGDEGQPVTFDASGSSDRDGTIVAYEWDFDLDGAIDATGITASHAFADDGVFTVALRVTDDSGEQDTDTAEVTVSNLPPVVEAGPDRTITEGDALTLVGVTFTDPGVADTHTATIDWGDGTVTAGVVDQDAGTVSGGHDYPDDGAFPVEVCVTDDDGATGCDTFTVTVENAAPVVVEEGDVDLRTWTAEHLAGAANWRVAADGRSVTQTLNTDPSVFYGPFTAIGVKLEGSIRVNTTADDDFIGFMLGFQPGDFSNPAAEYLMVDWKQGNQNAFGAFGRRGLAISRVRGVPTLGELWGHLDDPSNGPDHGVQELQRAFNRGASGWADRTTYTFTFETSPTRVRVFVDGVLELDVDGSFQLGGRFAFYNFSQGDVTYNAFTSQGVALVEGGTAELQVPFHDLGVEDVHTATIDWRDGTIEPGTVTETAGSGEVTGSHLYPDDGEFPVEVCVTDDDGGTGCGTIAVTVLNAAPTVEAGGDRLVYSDEGLSLEATYHDPGVLDVHTATIDWGDGTVEAGVIDPAAGTVRGFHPYAAGGEHTVEVCVDDGDGGVGCDRFAIRVLESVVDLSVDKRSAVSAVRPGEDVTFEIVVVNRGTRSLRNVV
ncbi:MAG TPA: PKD domain-containing protein, partial [Thermoanaerobaculia bacterium]|nr:PKD domain-containing protein [Thermoanaerobaculia bacterium]